MSPGKAVSPSASAASTEAAIAPPSSRPRVTLSWAQGIDGSIAAAPGLRTILSGAESMRMTHALRARHEGILVGIGTILADNPSLGVRLVEGRSPRPVVLDAGLRTPPGAKIFAEGRRNPIIVGARDGSPEKAGAAKDLLEGAGARILFVERDGTGGLDLNQTLAALFAEGIGSLMVEGGAAVLASFFEARLVDEIVITIAPVILGGLAPFAMPRFPPIGAAEAGSGREAPTARRNAAPAWLPCSLIDMKVELLGADIVVSGHPEWQGPPGNPDSRKA
ncbi:MAG TPA: RibD family protein [Rectinemataceae bacterium]|nr:RibD family protein [Rectinemataceae bacterium]